MTVAELITELRAQCAEAGKKPSEINVRIDCQLGNESDDIVVYADMIVDLENLKNEVIIFLEPTYQK